MTQRGLAEGSGLFHWHIGNQHRIDADFLALGIKLINAFVKHRGWHTSKGRWEWSGASGE